MRDLTDRSLKFEQFEFGVQTVILQPRDHTLRRKPILAAFLGRMVFDVAHLGGLGVQTTVGFQFAEGDRIQPETEKLGVQTVDMGFETGDVDGATMRSSHGGP